MLYFLYDIVWLLALPFIILAALTRTMRGKRRREGLGERFGFIAPEKLTLLAGHKVIWLHAVSVGETIAAKPLIKAIRQKFPNHRIVLSNVTETGHEIAAGLADIDIPFYFPFDLSLFAGRALRSVNPSCIVVVETEIWPNFLHAANRMGIPVMLANGRISDRSFGRYMKFARVFRRILPDFAALCMQTAEDARRIRAMGAPAESVHAVGNLKYDIPLRLPAEEKKGSLRRKYGLPARMPVFIAASTHKGEEEHVADAYRKLLSDGAELTLTLVPRHPERAGEVVSILAGRGITCRLRSALGAEPEPLRVGEALLVDTIGELMDLYSASDIAFVGGSFMPVGGHNVLEPASCMLPVLFGPYMHNFREISELLLARGGAIRVADADELAQALHSLLTNPARCQVLGENGARLLTENAGATERHLEIMASLMRSEG
ncbi:MAG: 3-deoxy-D-manno-octulosonic acid transferase [Geobacter sp.]|nr:3-deoxy-D-manno-octulosonic acid transferase [Geobacter sp.]